MSYLLIKHKTMDNETRNLIRRLRPLARFVRRILIFGIISWFIQRYFQQQECSDPYFSETGSFAHLYATKRSLTVVSGYFNVGKLPSNSNKDSNQLDYRELVVNFKNMRNPLVFYTDDVEAADLVWNVRRQMKHLTKIHLISRDSLWIWDEIDKFREHTKDNAMPEFYCLSHAKILLLDRAALNNVFQTDYFVWIDIEVQDHFPLTSKYFWMEIPDRLTNSVGFAGLSRESSQTLSISDIFENKMIQVSAAALFGHREDIPKLHGNLQSALVHLLEKGVVGTVDQTLTAMRIVEEIHQTEKIDYKLYIEEDGSQEWGYIYLALVMYREEDTYLSALDYKIIRKDA